MVRCRFERVVLRERLRSLPGGGRAGEPRKAVAVAVRIKRAYEAAEPADGYRVLIDRLWPRGVTRQEARLDEWARELAPSPELRRWFGHDPCRFEEVRRRYRGELADQQETLRALRRRARKGSLTLVYGARDTEHNGAVVLAELLRKGGTPTSRRGAEDAER